VGYQYWYHGTTRENADKILKTGFRAGTYFSWDLQSALVMGGQIVLEIFKDFDTQCWEYIIPEDIPASEIVRVATYSPQIIYRNKDAEKEVRRLSLDEMFPEKRGMLKICDHCDGRGQMEDYDRYMDKRKTKKVTPCPICHGHGAVRTDGKNWHDPVEEE